MEMVKIRPLIESIPLKNYDKTLYSWLCPQDEHISRNLYKSIKRKRDCKYVKNKALFLFILLMYKTAVWTLVNGGITHKKQYI